MTLNKIRDNKKKFLTTMVIIIISATMVNYGIYSILDFYFDTVETVYSGVQMNIIFTIAIIGVVTILMLAILPKQSVDEMINELTGDSASNNNKKNKTPDQILNEIIDDTEHNNKKILDDE